MLWSKDQCNDNSGSENIKNASKLDEFLNILLNQLERFKSISMRESQPGSELAKHESPRAKLRATGSRACSKIRPEHNIEQYITPSVMQNSHIWPVLVIFIIILAILRQNRQKEDFQSLLGVASLIYLSQLRRGCVKNVNFLVKSTLRFAFEIRLEIHETIKLELKI